MTLELAQVGFRYPGTRRLVLEDVSCAVAPGRVTVVIGPNAAGKTTLVRIMSGLLNPTAGRALIDGRPLRSMRGAERAGRIAYIAQRPTLGAGFTVAQTLALGRYALGASAGAIERALARTELGDLSGRGFHTLSAGQQQRVMLARALAQLDPWGPRPGAGAGKLLIADEPTSALDPRHAMATLSLFRELASRGVGVVAALHDLTSAVRVADRAIAMGPGGRIAAAGAVSQTIVPDILEPIYGVPFALTATPAGAVVTPVAPASTTASAAEETCR